MSEAINLGDVLSELNVKLPEAVKPAAANNEAKGQDRQAGDAEETSEDGVQALETEAGASTDEGSDADANAETVDDTDEGDDAEGDDPDAEEHEKEARSVRKLTKRVDKLTARAKSAETTVETVRAQLAEAEAKLERAQPIVLQDSQDILGSVMTVEDLDARVASADMVIDQVPDLLATADADGEVQVTMGDGSVKTFTKDLLLERLRLAKAIVKGESKRREFLAQRAPAMADAKREYPELFQESHPARKLMLDTLKLYPGLAKMPNVELAIGDMINGYLARGERAKLKGAAGKTDSGSVKPAAKVAPKIAPNVVRPSAQPKSAAKPKGDRLDALRKEGTRDAAERFVSNLFA